MSTPHLPDELLLNIIESLSLDTSLCVSPEYNEEFKRSQKTLASLCLVSKRLCWFTQPLLYRTFIKDEVKSTPDEGEDETGGKDIESAEEKNDQKEKEVILRPHTPLEKFIRTLIQRPDLAANVESLRIEKYDDEDDEETDPENDDDEAKSPFDLALAGLFESVIENLTDPKPSLQGPWRDWREGIRDGIEAAEVAILIMLVPNLRNLDLEPSGRTLGSHVHDLCLKLLGPQFPVTLSSRGYFSMEYIHATHFLSQSSNPLPILSKLQSLTLRSSKDLDYMRDRLELEECVSLLTLPTLKSFSGYRLQEEQGHEAFNPSLKIPIAHLQHLNLDDCRINGNSIKTLIKQCEELRSLRIAFQNAQQAQSYGYEVDMSDEFLECLGGSSGTMESLILIMPNGFGRAEITMPFDLPGFEKLRFLELDVMTVTNHCEQFFLEKLPRSIETLNLRCCDIQRADEFKDSLAAGIKDFPNLKVVGVGLDNEEVAHLDFDWAVEELKEAIKAADTGIQFNYWFEPPGLPTYI